MNSIDVALFRLEYIKDEINLFSLAVSLINIKSSITFLQTEFLQSAAAAKTASTEPHNKSFDLF